MVADNGDSEELKKMMDDHDKLVEEIFQHEDKDKNGFISHEEFSGPKHDELWKRPKLAVELSLIVTMVHHLQTRIKSSWH